MRLAKTVVMLVGALLVAATVAAQTTTGTISGRVNDTQGLPVPGATVTAISANLQGARTVVTSESGDYLLSVLPPGTYEITFEIPGFETQKRTVTLAATQLLPLNVEIGLATVTETVEVVATAANVLAQTAQVATSFNQELVNTLPTNRDINDLPVARAVRARDRPERQLLDRRVGVVREPVPGEWRDGERESARAGQRPLHRRRHPGDDRVDRRHLRRVRPLRRRRRQRHHEVGRQRLSRAASARRCTTTSWRRLTPFEDAAIAADPNRRELRVDKVVPTHEYTFGGPVWRDRLWFFTAGRFQNQRQGLTLVGTNTPYTFERKMRR